MGVRYTLPASGMRLLVPKICIVANCDKWSEFRSWSESHLSSSFDEP